VQNNQPADVKLEDHHTEAYVPPARPAYEAFAGQGQAIGEIALTHGPVITAGLESQGMLVIDETQATIRVQIKYPDGSKEVAGFIKVPTFDGWSWPPKACGRKGFRLDFNRRRHCRRRCDNSHCVK